MSKIVELPRNQVTHPEHIIPDLADRQAEDTGLPRDFWDAFDTYFALAASATDDDIKNADDRAELAEKVLSCRLGLTRTQMLEEWMIGLDGDSVSIAFDKDDAYCDSDYGWQSFESDSAIILRDKKLAQKVSEVSDARAAASELRNSMTQWKAIVLGYKPVWSFLPPTHRQTSRASNVRSSKQGACREAKRNGDEALVAEIEATMAYYDNCSGWPSGDMSPQWSESGQRWLDFDPKTNSFVPIAQALI